MARRFLFFGIGALISIIFLSMGPENRLKKTFYYYIEYFNMHKRVIWHLENNKTTFSSIAECQLKDYCQLVNYCLSKEELLSVLNDGEVNFKQSKTLTKFGGFSNQISQALAVSSSPKIKIMSSCKFYVVENTIKGEELSVTFEFCEQLNTVEVRRFEISTYDKICD